MAVDERSRHRLRLRLAEVLGEAEAHTLMDHLPPAGWGDAASRQDLAGLAASVRAQLDALGERVTGLDQRLTERIDAVDGRTAVVERRFADVDTRLERLEDRLVTRIERSSQDVLASIRVDLMHQARTFAFAQVGSVIAVGTLVLAAVHLA
jgi:hypothetical protein